MPRYRFHMRRVAARDDTYYMVRWDQADTISVIAETERQAKAKARKLSGELNRGFHWQFEVDHIEEVTEGRGE